MRKFRTMTAVLIAAMVSMTAVIPAAEVQTVEMEEEIEEIFVEEEAVTEAVLDPAEAETEITEGEEAAESQTEESSPAVEETLIREETVTEASNAAAVEVEKPAGARSALYAFDDIMLPFTDVEEGRFYYLPVKWAVKYGITSGTSATTFSPNQPCTRAQVVMFLWNAAGKPTPSTKHSFSDIKAGAYYEQAVSWASENGITSGYPNGTFAPNAVVRREDFVTFLWRYAGRPSVYGAESFSDVPGGKYYSAAIDWAVYYGVAGGVGDGRFGLGNSCTRAMSCSFLYRFFYVNAWKESGFLDLIFTIPASWELNSAVDGVYIYPELSENPQLIRLTVSYDESNRGMVSSALGAKSMYKITEIGYAPDGAMDVSKNGTPMTIAGGAAEDGSQVRLWSCVFGDAVYDVWCYLSEKDADAIDQIYEFFNSIDINAQG